MNIKLGTAPDSWGVWFDDDPKQIPWPRFLDEVAESGYTWTELGPYGYLPTELEVLKAELGKRNLRAAAGFVMNPLDKTEAWPKIEADTIALGKLLSGLGATYLVLIEDLYTDSFSGKQIAPATLDDDGWKRLIDTVNRVAELTKSQFDLQMVFHPHTDTHVQYEPQIERFLADTDPAAVSLCFDVGHHAYRGGNSVTFFQKHHARIPYLHLKSVDPQKRQQVLDNNIPFALAVADDMFCEPSRGVVDFPALVKLMLEIDYHGFAIVEQDMYPCPFDKPLPIAKRTRDYLREIGMG